MFILYDTDVGKKRILLTNTIDNTNQRYTLQSNTTIYFHLGYHV